MKMHRILAEAASNQASLPLRNEAIASLALADVRLLRQWPLRSRPWTLDPARRRLARPGCWFGS